MKPYSYAMKKNKNKIKIVAIDFGCKKNILNLLNSVGFEVTVVPSNYSFEKIMKYKPSEYFFPMDQETH